MRTRNGSAEARDEQREGCSSAGLRRSRRTRFFRTSNLLATEWWVHCGTLRCRFASSFSFLGGILVFCSRFRFLFRFGSGSTQFPYRILVQIRPVLFGSVRSGLFLFDPNRSGLVWRPSILWLSNSCPLKAAGSEAPGSSGAISMKNRVFARP